MKPLARYAWIVLAANVAVVLWGAVVRGTVSGAGCGQHWPKCNGQVIPPLESTKTLIEYSHRITSGVALLMVVALVVWAWRSRRTEPQVWKPAAVSLGFMLSEALIGAAIVLMKLVELDASVKRAVSMSLHLTNTFFLLGALTFTASAATFGTRPVRRGSSWAALGAVLLLGTGITGAIAALGDTLFPSASLAQGFALDTSASAHFLVRLRSMHPFLAVLAAALLWFGAQRASEGAAPRLAWLCRAFQVSLLVQLGLGVVNLLLLVPLWTQLLHLLSADFVIGSYALLVAHALTPGAQPATAFEAEPATRAV